MQKSGKLELTWVGKGEKKKIEPRILIENVEKSNIKYDLHTENMLIHGDNLIALKALEQNFSGMVKCIYIDPPYNIKVANPHYEDGLEHSEWLCMIKPRIELLHNLLNNEGILWISIDDAEMAHMTLVCNEIFGSNNFIACLPTVMNLKGNQDEFAFAGTHEYTLVYAKDKSKAKFYQYDVDYEKLMDEWTEDSKGYYKKGATLKSTGEESNREDRPKMFYPILIKDNIVNSITDEEYDLIYTEGKFDDSHLIKLITKYEQLGYKVVIPMKDANNYGRWRWGFEKFKANYDTEILITAGRNDISLYKKQRPEIGGLPQTKPKSLFYKPEYSSGNGTAQIKALFGYNAFPYPKPEDLIRDFIELSTKEGDIVLDSFLGSGTTCAVAHKMGRRWIGIELGDHAYTHCKIRLDKVIEGEQGGISKFVSWKGGGGYRFYELAPSLLEKHSVLPIYQVNREYTFEMLCEAICKLEGFKYKPEGEMHGKSSETRYIHISKDFISGEYIKKILKELDESHSVLIYGTKIQSNMKLPDNVEVKRIPKDLLKKFDFESEVK